MKAKGNNSFAFFISAVILGLAAVLLLFAEPGSLGAPLVASAAPITRYVAPGGVDSGDCLSSAAPCRTIQYAVDQATDFNQISIAQGTYTQTNVRPRNDITTTGSVTQVVYLTKTLSLRGGFTTTNWSGEFPLTQTTTIDARGKGRGVYIAISSTNASSLADLTVTNGNASGMGGGGSLSDDAGGGVYVHASAFNLVAVNIISNTADSGGGLYLHTNPNCPVCQVNTIISNTAKFGGGIYLRNSPHVTLTNNIISGNIVPISLSGAGGGIYMDNSPSRLQNNTISGNLGGAGGGGVFLHNSAATLQGNTISGNQVDELGGGLLLEGSNAIVNNNSILTNTTALTFGGGGGVYIDDTSGGSFSSNVIRWNTSAASGGGLAVASDIRFINNVIADNTTSTQGSGVYAASSSPQFEYTTIARNTGGDGSGVRTDLGASPRMTNTILVSQTIAISNTASSTISLNGSLFYSNTLGEYGGAGVINSIHTHYGDPLFQADGYHLSLLSSNAIDVGETSVVTTDIDGDVRPFSFRPDIGADEFIPFKLYLPHLRR